MWKPTTKPTRRSYERAGQTVEFYSPLIVRCPDGQKRTAYIKDNIYGEQTYLGEIRIYHMKNYEWIKITIPGWVKPNKKTYIFIPEQDHPFAFILYPAKERLV